MSEATVGEQVQLVLDRTPFYAESGGQVGDQGTLDGEGVTLSVLETHRSIPNLTVHIVQIEKGSIVPKMTLRAKINKERRQETAVSHTSTHLLHSALRNILGEHVGQSGSLVEPGRLRFDFSHYETISKEQLGRIETFVNDCIRQNDPVETKTLPLEDAKEQGALAFFGDKYGDVVRMVRTGDYSIELCGGTHLNTTGQAGFFKIINESSIAAGTRRIEAKTGASAIQHQLLETETLQEISNLLKTQPSKTSDRLTKLLQDNRRLERELTSLKKQLSSAQNSDLINRAVDVKGVSVVAEFVEKLDRTELRNVTDDLRNRLESGIMVLGSGKTDNVSLIVAVTTDLVGKVQASDIMKLVANFAGGRGGGKPELAQGGASDPKKAKQAISKAPEIITSLLT